MPLFDEFERIEHRPKRQNEDGFSYLNSSARPMACAVRQLLDHWFSRFPEKSKADLKSRFRKRDAVQHQGAFFELYLHEFLLCCGYQVEVHPKLGRVTTSPDFLAKKDSLPCFLLEATLALPPTDFGADRRLAEFHDALDRVSSSDYFLDMQYSGNPECNLKGRRLRGQLEGWLKSLDFDHVLKLYQDRDFDLVPTFLYEEHGLTVAFTPIPKGPAHRGRLDVRAIGINGKMEAECVRAHDDIKSALDQKAKKYGEPDLPLVVAINVLNDFFDDVDLKNALFGEEQITVFTMPDGSIHHDYTSRKQNGIWLGPKGPRNRTISAVLTANHLLPWTLRSSGIDLFHNPWAANPLPPDSLLIAQRAVSLENGKITKTAGIPMADLLGIPIQWPVPDSE